MKRLLQYIIVLIFVSMTLQQGSADIVRYKAIGFKGLKNVSKDEIIRRAGIHTDGSAIVIDHSMLKKALNDTAIIQKYSLEVAGENLVVNIVEKEPVVILALEGDNETVLCELDSSLAVIAYNRIYDLMLPVLHLKTKGAGSFALSSDVADFCTIMMEIKNKHSRFFAEIIDIEYGVEHSIVYLYGRKTQFIVNNSIDNFIRVKYISGYLDSMRRYPETVHIDSDKVLIKQGV